MIFSTDSTGAKASRRVTVSCKNAAVTKNGTLYHDAHVPNLNHLDLMMKRFDIADFYLTMPLKN